jgi:hypothetical protein
MLYRAGYWSLWQPAEKHHERGPWIDRLNMCQLVVQE